MKEYMELTNDQLKDLIKEMDAIRRSKSPSKTKMSDEMKELMDKDPSTSFMQKSGNVSYMLMFELKDRFINDLI